MAGMGKPKTGGRVLGTPNKKTADLHAKCEARGLDPFDLLLDFCGEAPMEVRLSALKIICEYLYPKRKAIELSGEVNNPFMEKSLEELEVLVKEKLENK